MNLLNFFFPERCAVCHKSGTLLCKNCLHLLKPTVQKCPMCCRPSVEGITHPRCLRPYGLTGLTSIWSYRQPEVRILIKEIKYKFSRELIAEIFKHFDTQSYHQIDLIIPLPLHARRHNWRGFNQAELIASNLSSTWKVPLLLALIKTRSTKPLAAIKSSQQRKAEINKAFAVLPENKKALKNKTILLVDDVFTSGSTMREATKTLKQSGVKQIYGWTLAN